MRSARAALSSALSQGSSRSRWGISTAGAQASVPASGRAGRTSAPAACSCRIRSGPTTASSSPGPACRDMSASACTGAPLGGVRPGERAQLDARPAPPARWRRVRRLQFARHFAPFAGITPQVLRVGAGGRFPWRHLSRPARQPPWVVCSGGDASARRRSRGRVSARTKSSSWAVRPALECRAVLRVGGDHAVAVVPVQARLGVEPERAPGAAAIAAKSPRAGPPVGAGVAEHDHGGARVQVVLDLGQELPPHAPVVGVAGDVGNAGVAGDRVR